MIIVRAANRLVNEGKVWTPDWSNHQQAKYYAWFEMRGWSGFRFYDYDYWLSHSYVGSRLALKTSEAATYIGKKFEALYRDFMVID
ncbi:MAG: hypothetical protein WDO15_11290 [Bacteroidota bacterium]